jgi:serine/threonine protein phosphatase 1
MDGRTIFTGVVRRHRAGHECGLSNSKWVMINSLINKLRPSASAASVSRLPDGVRVYAIGDVHGRVDLLQRLYGQIEQDLADRPVNKTLEVFLGDYVDRGPSSKQVIDWFIDGPRVANKRICLRGNHEVMMQAFLNDASVIGSWGQYGGSETLFSYGLKIRLPVAESDQEEAQAQFREAMPESHLRFLDGLQRFAIAGGYYFAHAGVNPSVPLADQVDDDLYWIRDPFLDWGRSLEKIVVHGHTPTQEPEIEVHRIGIDTGAYVTGRLTCAVLEGAEVRFLST